MAKDIKTLRNRIKSFDSTLHLTGAMGLVASSKIRKASEAMVNGRKYLSAVDEIVDVLVNSPDCRRSAYVRVDEEFETVDPAKTRLIVIAGDRGLCGGYNANVFRLVKQYPDVDISPIGRRAFDRYMNPDYTEDTEDDELEIEFDSSEYYTYEMAMNLAQQCCEDYKAGKIDRVGIVFNRYISIMSQEPDVKWILPLTRTEKTDEEKEEEKKSPVVGVFEPEPVALLDDIVPQYVTGVIYSLVKESFASEVAARRMAMDSATKNAQQMIDNLQLEYNRARQGAITQEITEIVAGSGK